MKTKIVLLLGITIALGTWWAYRLAKPSNSSGALVSVNVPVLSSIAQAGKQSFDAYCAACHGDNAAGWDGNGPPLVHKIYEPNHHGDQAFYMAVKSGVRSHHWPFGDMPPVADVGEDELKAIIEYVRELQRANGVN